jgi:hypothetical protein
MQLNAGGNHVHHHGLLAGLGAGAVAVLAAFGLVLAAWRQVSHSVGEAMTVLTWAVVVVVLAATVYVVGFLFLRLRHHVRYPETLTRQVVRAEIVPAAAPAAAVLPAAAPAAAIEAAGWRTRWQAAPVTGQEVER